MKIKNVVLPIGIVVAVVALVEVQNQRGGIRMIPTQIFFDAGGNELFRHEGFISKEDMLAKWEELGIQL